MTGKRAILIPADEAAEVDTFTWGADPELLSKLYAEMGCRYVEASPAIPVPDGGGELHFWLDEEGRVTSPPAEPNRRATALAMTVGWRPGMLVGNVVVTGGASESGETKGLSDAAFEGLMGILTGKAG